MVLCELVWRNKVIMKQTRRSRPRQAIFETAFVSSTNSSTEDLDEVDRIANHPLLRSSPHLDFRDAGQGMRRSRSEMGERGKKLVLAGEPSR